MRTTFLFSALVTSAFAFAQSAPNYDCAHAIMLPVAGSNIQASFGVMDGNSLSPSIPVPPVACPGTVPARSGWFSFVATASTHWIRSDGEAWNSGLGTLHVEAFSGTCGSLTNIGCAEGISGPLQLTGLSAGNTYYFRMFYPSSDMIGAVAVVSAPANNECATARLLTVKDGAAPVVPITETSTLGATQSLPGCSVPAASNDDVWYRFTATADEHWLNAVVPSGIALTTEWYSGTCGNLTSVACNNGQATGLVSGQEYYVRQYTTSTDPLVTTRAFIDIYAPAPNDECAGAVQMEVVPSGEIPKPVDLSLSNCTSSTVPCGTTTKDVWVWFEAPTSTVSGYLSQARSMTVYSGSCGSLVCVEHQTYDTEHQFDGLTPGETYWMKIGYLNASTDFQAYLFARPANDDCATAQVIDVQLGEQPTSWTSAHTLGASQSSPGCSSAGESDDDIWYRFTAMDSVLRAYANPIGSNGPMRMEVYSGTCGSLTNVVCSGLVGYSTPSTRLAGLTIGAEHYLRIYTTSPVARTALRIAIARGVVNDGCDGALPLQAATLNDYDDANLVVNTNATNGTYTCGSFARDLWYRFTATGPRATFVGEPYNFNAELYSGSCGALTSLACQANVEHAGFGGLTTGQEYRLRVAGTGHVFIPLLFMGPANDEVGGAVMLPADNVGFASHAHEGWTYGATQSYGAMCDTGTPDDDVWYTFIATATSHTVRVERRNMHYEVADFPPSDLRIEAYDSLTTDSAGLAAAVLTCGDGTETLTGLTIGDTILFRVSTWNAGAQAAAAFLVSVSNGDNDDADGALALPYGDDYTAIFNTAGATQSLPGANCSVDDFADDDIWFKFTATNAAARIIVTLHTEDLALELFSGAPGNLTSVSCSDNILVLPDNLTSGQTYYVRLYSWENSTPVEGRIGLFNTLDPLANTCVDVTCLGPVLLQNPSIEQGANCWPVTPLGNDPNLGASLAPGWFDFHGGTSDSYSSCADVDSNNEAPAKDFGTVTTIRIPPRTGKGMGGLLGQDQTDNWREYLTAPLTAPLQVGEPYLVSFHVAMPSLLSNKFATDGMGALLTVGAEISTSTVPSTRTPQVMSLEVIRDADWVNICGVVVPDQPYDHITIGNFLTDEEQAMSGLGGLPATTSYYFIDDVVVALVTDPGCITSLGDVPPLDESANGEGDNLRVYPNPASDRVHIVCDADLFGKRGVIEVFDVTGKRVHAEQVSSLNALQQLDLSSEWPEGLYLVMVRAEGEAPRTARVILKR